MSRTIRKVKTQTTEGIAINDEGEKRTTFITRARGGAEITIDQFSLSEKSQTVTLLEDDLLDFFNMIIIPKDEVKE